MQQEHEQQTDDPEHREHPSSRSPRIYAASLSDYNAGRLHGAWITADQDADDIDAAIAEMLSASHEAVAEEWAIHDYEGFGPMQLSEFETTDTISRLGEGIAEHGPAFAHWAAYVGTDESELDRFEDAYLGQWASLEEYAEQLLDDLGINIDELGPDVLQPYIRLDIEAFARDLSYELHASDAADGVHIFEP